jgi:hypothetical protein
MRTPTAYKIDQNAVNLIHEYFNELLKPVTLENEYYEPKKSKAPTRNNDRRHDSKRINLCAGKPKRPY